MRVEQTLQQVVDLVELQPSQQLQERDDDWFALFESFREDPVKLPSGIQHPYTRISVHSMPRELVYH